MARIAQVLNQIVIDYTPENCRHLPDSNTIINTFDQRGYGTCWHSPTRFLYGTFSAWIKCPPGNTSGLNFNFYLSTLESSQEAQDEIDFEILGNNMNVVETNYYADGIGKHEQTHDQEFNCSEGFHKYAINWSEDVIEWFIDQNMVRRVVRREGEGFPSRPMYVYSSIWNAGEDHEEWAGVYDGRDAPYDCVYMDVLIPVENAVVG